MHRKAVRDRTSGGDRTVDVGERFINVEMVQDGSPSVAGSTTNGESSRCGSRRPRASTRLMGRSSCRAPLGVAAGKAAGVEDRALICLASGHVGAHAGNRFSPGPRHAEN